MFSIWRKALAACAVLVLVPGVVAIAAAPAAAQSSDAAYADLYDAMNDGVDHEIALDRTMEVVRREYAAVPIIAKLEEMEPGILDEIVGVMRPVFRDYQDRVSLMYRPRMEALFARHLTPSEANDIAAFYRTDIGQRILNGVSRNYSPDATLSDIQKFKSASDEQVEQSVATDLRAASEATVAELSSEDLIAVGRMAQTTPALTKLAELNPGIVELRTQMEQQAPNADEEARIQAAIENVFAKREAR